MHSSKPLPVKLLWFALLLTAVLLLTGCKTPPQKPCASSVTPTVPPLQLELPTKTYTQAVQEDLLMWDKRLTDTLQTYEP